MPILTARLVLTRTSTLHPGVVLQVEVLRMWQRDMKTVAVRWTLRCAPRLTPGRAPKVLSLDGISEYKFNSRGFIREHTVRPPTWANFRVAVVYDVSSVIRVGQYGVMPVNNVGL